MRLIAFAGVFFLTFLSERIVNWTPQERLGLGGASDSHERRACVPWAEYGIQVPFSERRHPSGAC